MNGIASQLRYWGQQAGWSNIVGVVLIIAAVLIYTILGAPAAHRLHGMQAGAAQMRAAIAQHKKNWVPESPRASLRVFYQSLPAQNDIPVLLETIFDAAYESNLAPETGEFKLTQEIKAPFLRYQITLPVQGSYANTRKFVNRVLQEIPSAALDEINFSREDVRVPEVEAKVRFTLYLKDKP